MSFLRNVFARQQAVRLRRPRTPTRGKGTSGAAAGRRPGCCPPSWERISSRSAPGVAVLLKIYAHCIDRQADAANSRITDAVGAAEPEPGPDEERDDKSEQAS